MENEKYNLNNISLEEKIDRLILLEEENADTIKKMRKSQKIQNIFRTIYWIIIIGAALSTYYFLQPTLNSVVNDYKAIKTRIDSFSNDASSSVNLLEQIQNIIR